MLSNISFKYSLCGSEGSGRENCQKALRLCLEDYLGEPSTGELAINNHLFLDTYPQFSVSTSHTQNLGAVILADRATFPSVGIDIEFQNRKVPIGGEKYFRNDQDEDFESLILWTLKEAAFKALSPKIHQFERKTLLLKDIWCRGDSFGLLGRDENLGTLSHFLEDFKGLWVQVSLAFLK